MTPGPIHIIGEAGTNHGGDVDTARRLIDIGVTAGVDSVKFQVIYPEGLYLTHLRQNGTLTPNPVVEQRRRMMLSDDDYRALARYCSGKGVPMSASVFDERGVKLLDELDAPYIKLASCDLNNHRLLRTAAATGRRLVVSTGMASLGEIERSVAAVVAEGCRELVLMHCVSSYPCPLEQMNLPFLTVLRSAFGFPVGLSDHTETATAAGIAVALGATWIEKHYTYDRKAEGFDHAYAMEPEPMAAFVREVRAAAAALVPADQKLRPGEAGVKPRARRGVYVARDIAPDEAIHECDVLVVRPESALSPEDVPRLIGRRTRRALGAFEPLSWEALT